MKFTYAIAFLAIATISASAVAGLPTGEGEHDYHLPAAILANLFS